MTLARGEREWALLVSEYNICKKKLESKRQALKILMGDLESCQRERDIYKNKIRQMQQEIETYQKKELENDQKEWKERKSPTSPTVRSPEHSRLKKDRKFSGHSIWEQELQSVRDRKNKTLSQLLCEAREENKALKNDFMDLRVLYREAQEDIILLRENVARQRTSEKGCKMEDLEARQDLIQHLEKNQEKVEELEREVQAANDEKSEIITERDHYRDKVERLNTQLNFILGADERRLVDIDAILMENRYQTEQIKQLKEDVRIANASLARQKAAIEKKKARLAKAGYHTGPGPYMGGAGVKQSLPSLISEISSSFGHGPSSTTINDLQSLANSLSESLSEKDIALLHQRNTNKILGTRVAELEKKLKTLEVSGLWSLEGHHGYGSEDMLKLYLEKLKRSPSSSNDESSETIKVSDLSNETEMPSAESSPDLQNGDSVFFGHDIPDTDQELIDVSSASFTPTISEEEEDDHCENNNKACNSDTSPCGVSACSLEKHTIEGDSLTESDSPIDREHDAKGDSPLHELSYDIKEGSTLQEEYNVQGDSPSYENSNIKGETSMHRDFEEDSPLGDDSNVEEGSSMDSDNNYSSKVETCVTDSENQETIRETFASSASYSLKHLTDNSTNLQSKIHSSNQSSERSRLNAPEKHSGNQYGALGAQSHQININDTDDTNEYNDSRRENQILADDCESFDDYSQVIEEGKAVSDYYEPESLSLDDQAT